MQNVKPGGYMAASAKRAIDGAMTDAKAQRVTAAPAERPAATPTAPGTPSAAGPASDPT